MSPSDVWISTRSYLENAILCLLSRNLQKKIIIFMFLFIFYFWSTDVCKTEEGWSQISIMGDRVQGSGINWKKETALYMQFPFCSWYVWVQESSCANLLTCQTPTHTASKAKTLVSTPHSNSNDHIHRNTSSCIWELQTPMDNWTYSPGNTGQQNINAAQA